MLSVSDIMRNSAVLRFPSVSSASSSRLVTSRSSAMSKGARRAPQLTKIDLAVLPETSCQGLFTKGLQSSKISQFKTTGVTGNLHWSYKGLLLARVLRRTEFSFSCLTCPTARKRAIPRLSMPRCDSSIVIYSSLRSMFEAKAFYGIPPPA